jgi:3-oxoacyl-[acyl-carrier-protein] synthase-3
VLSTFTSDHRLPQSASIVAHELGLDRAKVLQFDAACGGFIDGCIVADGVLRTLGGRRALIVHAETMSSLIDEQRFMMQAIFGDGAGAVVLEDDPSSTGGVLGFHTATEADGPKLWWLEAGGGCASPITEERLYDRAHYFTIDYKAIFDYAVDRMSTAVHLALASAGRRLDEVDWIVAHQTGTNIIHAVADRLEVDRARFLMTIENTGNTSGATIPIALDRHHRSGMFRPGELLVLPAVGAGMVWGALAVEWTMAHQPLVVADAPATIAAAP